MCLNRVFPHFVYQNLIYFDQKDIQKIYKIASTIVVYQHFFYFVYQYIRKNRPPLNKKIFK